VGGKKSEELLVSTAVPLLVQLSVRLYVCVTAMYDEWWDVRGDETRRDETRRDETRWLTREERQKEKERDRRQMKSAVRKLTSD
jgi:hypothetical protein